jgi:microcystin-dependent protein
MGATTNYTLRYPEPTNPSTVAQDLQNLANDVDAYIMAMPIGMSFEWDYGAAQIPSWTLLQYGQAVSRLLYPSLAALASAASYPHGSGDGSTTFNIADKRGRISAGKDNMGGTAASRLTAALSGDGTVLGAAVGAEGIALTTAQIPSHSHTGATAIPSANHAHSGHSGTITANHLHGDNGHQHIPAGSCSFADGWMGSGNNDFSDGGGDRYGSHYGNQWLWGNTGYMNLATENYDHAHYTNTGGVSANEYHAISSEGGGAAHQNTQPTIIVNQIVRAL